MQFNFDLYFEVRRSTTEIEEFDENGKRLWLKVTDLNNALYLQHYSPTVLNTEKKILTTKQYVPEYLKQNVNENIGKSKTCFIHILSIYKLKIILYYGDD